MPFHLDANKELGINSKIEARNQKYWSIVVYAEYGLCLPQYVYNSNYISIAVSSSSNASSNITAYDVNVAMTVSTHTPHTNAQNAPTMVVDLKSMMNKAKQCDGYVLFRLVHPTLTSASSSNNNNIN